MGPGATKTNMLHGTLVGDLIIISRFTKRSINCLYFSRVKACDQVTSLSSLSQNSKLVKGEKISMGLMALNIWKH